MVSGYFEPFLFEKPPIFIESENLCINYNLIIYFKFFLQISS